MLLAELVAVRSQVDRLLDQQQVLLGMVQTAAGLAPAPAVTAESEPGPRGVIQQQAVACWWC